MDAVGLRVTLHLGDCVEVMRELEPTSVDAVVCDPPYGLEFMGKDWDRLGGARIREPSERDQQPESAHNASTMLVARNMPDAYVAGPRMQEWHEAWAREAFRVLKPGGHLLAFGGTRTYHRLACAVEDAGFEIRDTISWLYGSGFPKSLDVSKAIDKQAGATPQVVGPHPTNACPGGEWCECDTDGRSFSPTKHAAQTAPATDDARRWQGWGTALKPAHEPIVVARKPLVGTVAANVLEHGVGALNVDGCRIEGEFVSGWSQSGSRTSENVAMSGPNYARDPKPEGRWPANVVLDETAAAMLDEQSGERPHSFRLTPSESAPVDGWGASLVKRVHAGFADSGGASRFFYVAKASRAERNAGLDGFEEHDRSAVIGQLHEGVSAAGNTTGRYLPRANHHPTVKPVQLMRWLVRLVTPLDGVVLDPFLGSGTSGIAAALEGLRFVGIEREPDYLEIARARIQFWVEHGEDGLRIVAERDQAEAARQVVADAGQLDILSLLDEGAAA